MTNNKDLSDLEREPGSRWKKLVFATLLSVLVLSTLARGWLAAEASGESSNAERNSAVAPNSLTGGLPEILQQPGGTGSERTAEPAGLEAALPYLTEGSFFALIGFALGYASRKLIKLLLIFVAIFFLGVQALSYGGVLEVDWSKAIDVLNGWILNLKENESISEVLKDKVPTAGALIAGYWLGFRRG